MFPSHIPVHSTTRARNGIRSRGQEVEERAEVSNTLQVQFASYRFMYKYARSWFMPSRMLIYISVLSDPEDIPHGPGIQGFDSIYITVPPSMPHLLESSLPPSSPPSQANDSSLYLSYWKCSTKPLASADSGSFSPTDTGMLAPISLRSHMFICIRTQTDPGGNTHDTDAPSFDSIFMTIPPSMPCLLDLSLPPSSSQSSSSSLYVSHLKHSEIPPTRIDSQSFSPTDIGTQTLQFHGFIS